MNPSVTNVFIALFVYLYIGRILHFAIFNGIGSKFDWNNNSKSNGFIMVLWPIVIIIIGIMITVLVVINDMRSVAIVVHEITDLMLDGPKITDYNK